MKQLLKDEALPKAVTRITRILVVDDSKTQRLLICARLRRWGYHVVEAADGAEALAILKEQPINLVLSDWVMPKLSGPELCQAIRAEDWARYIYVILLTTKNLREDVLTGLSAGADDFLSKPVDEGELHARLQAGQRLLMMQDELIEKNRQITDAYAELKTLYESIERDLRVAATLQQEVVPPQLSEVNGSRIAVHYQAAGHVGGDLVGFFPIGSTGLGIYSIDVSGHGVASCLLTIRLAQLFNGRELDDNIALVSDLDGGFAARRPEQVVRDLNDRFCSGEEHDLYFTIAYAAMDLATGEGSLAVAGHGEPILLSADGTARFLFASGPPVGLLQNVDFEAQPIRLAPGDRLFLYSDGITEARNPSGAMVGDETLKSVVETTAKKDIAEVLPMVMRAVDVATEGEPFDDDVSAIVLELTATQ
ncbi:MAG: SpoIIE family protein phosphatase [Pseudomonadota bacterium]